MDGKATNVPDELAYHEPCRGNGDIRKEGKLFLASRIISAVCAPFMVPFLAFFLLLFFTYLAAVYGPPQRFDVPAICCRILLLSIIPFLTELEEPVNQIFCVVNIRIFPTKRFNNLG